MCYRSTLFGSAFALGNLDFSPGGFPTSCLVEIGEYMYRHDQLSLEQRAVELFQDGRRTQAANLFRELIDNGCREAKVLSYGGLLIATEEGDVKSGLAWCERAVEIAFYDVQMYINLARLHERTGWRSQAAKVLRKGLRQDPGNPRLLAEINRVSPRARDIVPLLPREHVVNKTIGKLRAELRGSSARVKPKTSPSYS